MYIVSTCHHPNHFLVHSINRCWPTQTVHSRSEYIAAYCSNGELIDPRVNTAITLTHVLLHCLPFIDSVDQCFSTPLSRLPFSTADQSPPRPGPQRLPVGKWFEQGPEQQRLRQQQAQQTPPPQEAGTKLGIRN